MVKLTIPLMLRITEEVNRNAEKRATRSAAAHTQAAPGVSVDLTKMTAEHAAATLRKYGFG